MIQLLQKKKESIKLGELLIEEDINKIGFLDYKNISKKDSNYKGKKRKYKKL